MKSVGMRVGHFIVSLLYMNLVISCHSVCNWKVDNSSRPFAIKTLRSNLFSFSFTSRSSWAFSHLEMMHEKKTSLVKIGNCIYLGRYIQGHHLLDPVILVRHSLLDSKHILLRCPNFSNMATTWDSCTEDIWENVVPIQMSWQRDQALASEREMKINSSIRCKSYTVLCLEEP